ncbi:Mbov_0119 family protein [Mycoplasma elephantis]|uniref:Mbov_0119 family protein n=1 Tax=Mycoplasma elephantis TaxID=114882 RepID=UPI0004809EC7|nr:transglutaminase-like domain-containing protein [Mycoplasma elephantis]
MKRKITKIKLCLMSLPIIIIGANLSISCKNDNKPNTKNNDDSEITDIKKPEIKPQPTPVISKPAPSVKREKSDKQKEIYEEFLKIFNYKQNKKFDKKNLFNGNGLLIHERAKKTLEELNEIFNSNYDYYESSVDKDFYRLSLEEFLAEQKKSASNDNDLKIGKIMHLKYLLNFLNIADANQARKFSYSSKQTNSANQILDEIESFISYQNDNKDLVFDIADAYNIKPDEELLYVKEGATNDIKNVRKAMLKEGFLNIHFIGSDIPEERKKYYDNIYRTIHNKSRANSQTNIYAAYYKLSSDYLGLWGFFSSLSDSNDEKLLDGLLNDPKYFGYDGTYNNNIYNKFLGLDDQQRIILKSINTPNRYAKKEYQAIKQMAIDNLPKIISNKFTNEQKTRAISNWIMHRLKYAWREFAADKTASNWNIRSPYTLTNDITKTYLKHLKGKGVCESYSRLFLLFTTFADIKANYITGLAGEPHAWNNVFDDKTNSWKYVDLTYTDNSDYELAKLKNQPMSSMLSDTIVPYFYNRKLIFSDWENFAKFNNNYNRNISLYIRFTNYVRSWFDNNDYYHLPSLKNELRYPKIDYFTPRSFVLNPVDVTNKSPINVNPVPSPVKPNPVKPVSPKPSTKTKKEEQSKNHTSSLITELNEKPFLSSSNPVHKNIEPEVDESWRKDNKAKLKNNFDLIFSKPIHPTNINVQTNIPEEQEILEYWNELINLFGSPSDNNEDYSLSSIAKFNCDIYQNNYLYLTSLFNFFDSQTRNKMDLDINSNGVIEFDHTKQHFGFIYNYFLTEPNSFKKFVDFCKQYEKDFLHTNIYYVKQIVNDIKKFVELQCRNRDLAFDPTKDGFHFDINNFDFINKAPNEQIKKIRQEIFENGGLYDLNNPSKVRDYFFNNPDWEKFKKKFDNNSEINGIKIRDKHLRLAWMKINTTLLTGIYGYFNATAESNDGNVLAMLGSPEVKGTNIVYRHKKSEWKALRQYVIDSLPYIISKNFTREQALRSLHNFIIWRMNYDFAKTANEIKTRKPDLTMRNPAVYSLTPEKNKKVLGVCETYARVMALFSQFLNLNVIYTTGDINYYDVNKNEYSSKAFTKTNQVEPHAYNMYYSNKDKKFYFIDLTWDDINDKNMQLENITTAFNNSDVIPFKYTYYLKDWADFASMKDPIDGKTIVNKNKTQIIRSLDMHFYLMSEWFKENNLDRKDCEFRIPDLDTQHEWNFN